MNQRTIAVVTSSRADYAHLYWTLRAMEAHEAISTKLIATGALLSPEFGYAVEDILKDGFTVDERVECLLSSDTDAAMARTIGTAVLGFTGVLERMRPDLLVLPADRYEMLAPASVALALRIPIAHIEGGEISEGAIDHAVRNALTMMSHVHLAPTTLSAGRIVAMGEEPWRVHCVGALSLDHLARGTLLDSSEVEDRLGISLHDPVVVIGYHPETLARDPEGDLDEIFDAWERLDAQLLFCYPNADVGSRALIDRTREFCAGSDRRHCFVNLERNLYWSLLAQADLMCGNSSSGIMESPSLNLPAINIGGRQEGRERAINIIDVDPDADAICRAVERALFPGFRASLGDVCNPYGDGMAADRVTRILAETPLGDELLRKRAVETASREINALSEPLRC